MFSFTEISVTSPIQMNVQADVSLQIGNLLFLFMSARNFFLICAISYLQRFCGRGTNRIDGATKKKNSFAQAVCVCTVI